MFPITTETDLIYNLVEERLSGSIDGTVIQAHAVSGGRAGSKQVGVLNPFLANNPYATHVKKTSQNPGGPLIMGKYNLKTHESKPNWIRLIPLATNDMRNRAGFAIHGRGAWGSDGCIVPTDFHVVQTLCSLVKVREKAGKAAPTLAVISLGDLDYLEKKLQRYSQTV